MIKKLIINSNVVETRIALIEGERVAELYVERHSKRGMVGNIYKGKVTRVLPGMQSAFVDIGVDRSAFLFGGDVVDREGKMVGKSTMLSGRNSLRDDKAEGQLTDFAEEIEEKESDELLREPIQNILSCGQEIVVQVAKEPLGSKGPRVTMQIAVPGRYLVLMPDFDTIGISRRITDEALRQEVKSRAEQIKPAGMGLIIRTVAAQMPIEVLKKDLEYLLEVWSLIKERKTSRSAPTLLYQEPDLVVKTVRDLYSDEIFEIIVDDAEAYNQLVHFLEDSIPGAVSKLRLYNAQNPIFDAYGVELDIAKALSKKVWLPSGGYLVIDQTEALTSFDVNTGKFVGTKDVQETILATNLEAATEIAHQLRIRNLGGIIVIDFIDMEKMEHRELVSQRLEEALKSDKARSNVLAINELGLVHMTRKRTMESLERSLTDMCPYCSGLGRVLTVETLCYDLMREIERYVLRTGNRQVKVRIRNDLKDWLLENEAILLESIIEKHKISIEFESNGVDISLLREAPYEVLS
jgi:ribonuclease G